MRFRPGANLIRLAVLAVGFSAAAWFFQRAGDLVAMLAFVALVASAVDAFWLRRALSGIHVALDAPARVARGAAFDLIVSGAGPKGERVHGELRCVLPPGVAPARFISAFSLLPDQSDFAIRRPLAIAVRGKYEVGPLVVRAAGRMGMLDAQKQVDTRASIRVLPECLVDKDSLEKDTLAEMRLDDRRTRARRPAPGTEYESLHEYRPGDDVRHIDWRASARISRLIVRRYQVQQHRDLIVLLDCGRLMGTRVENGAKLDCAVDAALRLFQVAVWGGDRCGLGLFDNGVVGFLPPADGAPALRAIIDRMADLQPTWRESDFAPIFAELQVRQRKRSLVIVLSDIVDAETSRRFRTALAAMTNRHVVLFAALQTPAVAEMVREPVASLDDAARHAVGFRLLRDRELAIHSLRKGSVQVLDVHPAQLAAPLINQFLELRTRNLV